MDTLRDAGSIPAASTSKAICDLSQVAFLFALAAKCPAKKQPQPVEFGLVLLTLPPISVDFQAEQPVSNASTKPLKAPNSLIVPCQFE